MLCPEVQNQGFEVPGDIQTAYICWAAHNIWCCNSSKINEIIAYDMYLYGLFSGCVPDSVRNLRGCFLKLITFGAINIIHDHETMQATTLLVFLISLGRKHRSGT